MDQLSTVIQGLLVAVFIGAMGGWYLLKTRVVDRRLRDAGRRAREIQENAAREGKRIQKESLLEAKDQVFKWRTEAERELQERRQQNQAVERRVSRREEGLDRRERQLRRRKKELEQRIGAHQGREKQLEMKREKIGELEQECLERLEAAAGMSIEEAKQSLLKSVESEAMKEAVVLVKNVEDEARRKADQEARKIITQAIQRCAGEHVVATTVSSVGLPTEDMKGRIIGREGRNIRALEQATGVELIVDDTPEAVILSAFDPFRRAIAKIAIERLIQDGRIHPARIEEVVAQVERDMDKQLLQEGEQVVFELGIHNMDPELIRLLGRLKYRTSYGQNVLNHSREVAYLASIMARELGADVEVCKRAGLLHDVGKSIDREVERTHLQLGVDIAKKCGESPEVVHAIEAHHFDVEFRTLEAMLVQAADATSAARPGARREMLENYIKRLESLETIANSFNGVSKAYALQAGREVRIIVESSEVSDDQAFWLTKDIARRIESEVQYPGQVKVTVIREMRVVDYAR
jgi:ribonuclease Y